MNDSFGNKLTEGDEVAVMVPNYRTLVKAKVVRFTPKMIVVKPVDTRFKFYGNDEIRQFPDQVAKI